MNVFLRTLCRISCKHYFSIFFIVKCTKCFIFLSYVATMLQVQCTLSLYLTPAFFYEQIRKLDPSRITQNYMYIKHQFSNDLHNSVNGLGHLKKGLISPYSILCSVLGTLLVQPGAGLIIFIFFT